MSNRFVKIKIWLLIWAIKNFKGYSNVSTKALYAQAWHETGDFKSQVYKENNNLFGMRHPSVRKTYSTGSNKGHAVFKSHFYSILDYFERQRYFNISNSEDNAYMVETVTSNYAEDPAYLSKWRDISSTINAPISNFSLISGLFFFGLLILVLFNLKKIKKWF